MERTKLMELGDEALVHHELALERDLVRARFRLKTGQLEDTSVLGVLRKDIARARTEQRRRELEAGLGKNALRERYRHTFRPDGQAEAAAGEGEKSGGFLKGVAEKFFGGGKEEAEGQAG